MTSRPPARVPADNLVWLRRARDHADRCYAEPLVLDDLAAVAGMSKYQFHRLFTATYEDLRAKGVEFLQAPAERPYGVEALMRDNSGNWMVIVEPHDSTPEDFEGVDFSS